MAFVRGAFEAGWTYLRAIRCSVSPRASATLPYGMPQAAAGGAGDGIGTTCRDGRRGSALEPKQLTPDWWDTKEWAQDITFIDDPKGWRRLRAVVDAMLC